MKQHYQGFWIILILQDKTLFKALEAGDIVWWLVNQPIVKLDLFKSSDCRWICKTYAEYCYTNSATVRRLVQSPTLQSTIFCSVHSGLRGKGIQVSPAWHYYFCVGTGAIRAPYFGPYLILLCRVEKLKHRQYRLTVMSTSILLDALSEFMPKLNPNIYPCAKRNILTRMVNDCENALTLLPTWNRTDCTQFASCKSTRQWMPIGEIHWE